MCVTSAWSVVHQQLPSSEFCHAIDKAPTHDEIATLRPRFRIAFLSDIDIIELA